MFGRKKERSVPSVYEGAYFMDKSLMVAYHKVGEALGDVVLCVWCNRNIPSTEVTSVRPVSFFNREMPPRCFEWVSRAQQDIGRCGHCGLQHARNYYFDQRGMEWKACLRAMGEEIRRLRDQKNG